AQGSTVRAARLTRSMALPAAETRRGRASVARAANRCPTPLSLLYAPAVSPTPQRLTRFVAAYKNRRKSNGFSSRGLERPWYICCSRRSPRCYSGHSFHAPTDSALSRCSHRGGGAARRPGAGPRQVQRAGRIRHQGRPEQSLERSALSLAEGGGARSDLRRGMEQPRDCLRARRQVRGGEEGVRESPGAGSE